MNEVMNKEELFAKFAEMFPDWSKKATSYYKIGSRTIVIKFAEGTVDQDGKRNVKEVSRVFLYIGPDNWQFGTKLWRKRPEKKGNKVDTNETSADSTEHSITMER